MCGITGFIDRSNHPNIEWLAPMVDSLRHRGPNDTGSCHYQTQQALIALGHTRLSIIDLSDAGQQPMTYKHLAIVFNGEVYNFRQLRQRLRGLGHRFKTGTDTEVVLRAYAEWGVHCLEYLIGMFAFAIFDRARNELVLARDRTGIKPLYYSFGSKHFLFGSELKSLMAHAEFERQVCPAAIESYLDLGYLSGAKSIFKRTKKLKPGHVLTLNVDRWEHTVSAYWSVAEHYRQPKAQFSYSEAKSTLHDLILSACQYRMIADVPIGVFLSGGYDSTAVAAMIQATTNRQIDTFTIGFESGNNEAPEAQRTANHLQTNHNEHICTPTQALSIVSDLPTIYDEPFADSSAIPTILVSRFAQKKVTVALSADGGDELFAGYPNYKKWRRYRSKLKAVPKPVSALVGHLAKAASLCMSPNYEHRRHQLSVLGQCLTLPAIARDRWLYDGMNRIPARYKRHLIGTRVGASEEPIFDTPPKTTDVRELPMLVDYLNYLPDDILVKVDRASMSASLEARTPLLDHRILEFTATLPFEYKATGGTTKRILKDIVHDYVPETLMQRPKRGFSVPLKEWMGGPLKEMMWDRLSPSAVRSRGLLDENAVTALLHQFSKNQLHYTDLIWKLFVFEQWADRWNVNA